MTKVLVFGTFDHLHIGHLNFFKQAKKLGDYLIVVIARDKTVKKIKDHFPKQNEKQRFNQVKQQKIVNKVLFGNLDSPYKIVRQVKPDIIALGYDQSSFTKDLKNKIKIFGLKIKIIRLKSYKPKIYKSSKLKNLYPALAKGD